LKRAKTDPSLESGPMREEGSAGTLSGARRAKKGPVNLKGLISLALDALFFYFFFAFSTIFSLFRRIIM